MRPYGADNYSGSIFAPTHEKFVREGFIFALQDVRGRMKSEGQFVDMRPQAPAQRGPKDIDESTDTYDTIDWLVKHVVPNNGQVGIWGISYPGFYAAMSLIEAHPDVDLETVSTEQIYQWVLALPEFGDDPALVNDDFLVAILREWYEESSGI